MTDTFLADTPVGKLHKGDIIWYQRYNRRLRYCVLEWAVVSSRSSLSPRLVFGRNQDDRARVVAITDITRISRKETA